jgi:hypothetical protein
MRLGSRRVDKGTAGEEDDSDSDACPWKGRGHTKEDVVEVVVGAGDSGAGFDL